MNAREKADWLAKANPYKQEYMREAFKQGARTFWTGAAVETYLLSSREKVAFWKGYTAAEEAAP